MEAISSGITVTVVRSSISTSSVKSIPAIGALNIPAIPADHEHSRGEAERLSEIRAYGGSGEHDRSLGTD